MRHDGTLRRHRRSAPRGGGRLPSTRSARSGRPRAARPHGHAGEARRQAAAPAVQATIVHGPEVPELIACGALSDFVIRAVGKSDLAGIRKLGGDYSRKELAERVTAGAVVDAVHAWQHEAGGRQTLGFAVSRDHGRALQARFLAAGVPCGYADGSMGPSERAREFGAFEARAVPVLMTVDLVGEGYDCPGLRIACCSAGPRSPSRSTCSTAGGR